MRITKQEIKTVEETVTCEILCNKCGKSLLHLDFIDEEGNTHFASSGIVEYTYKAGYYSGPLEDTTTYTFSLCELCLDALFKSFLISVNISSYSILDGTVFSKEERQEKFNQIHGCQDSKELVNHLLDEDQAIREYAKIRIEQLEKK